MFKRITPLQIILEITSLVVLVLQLLLFNVSNANSMFAIAVTIFVGLAAFLPKQLAKDGDDILRRVADATYTMKIFLKLELLLIIYGITQFQLHQRNIPLWFEAIALVLPAITLVVYYWCTKRIGQRK